MVQGLPLPTALQAEGLKRPDEITWTVMTMMVKLNSQHDLFYVARVQILSCINREGGYASLFSIHALGPQFCW